MQDHLAPNSKALPAAFALLAALAGAAAINTMSLKAATAVGVAGVFTIVLFSMPARKALSVYLLYLFVEGMIKVLTNYNPVFHLAGDLLLISTLIRIVYSNDPFCTLDKQVYHKMRAIAAALCLYWLWVAVQFLNPFGLGLIPSLAAMKIYAVPMLTFFIAGYLLKPKDLVIIPYLIVLICLFEAGFAIFDWSMGENFIPSLSGRYRTIMGLKFVGPFYRPFGTTYAPGGPALFIFLSAPALIFVLHHSKSTRFWRPLRRKIWLGISSIFLLTSVVALLVCQVRTMMLRFALVLLTAAFSAGPRVALVSVATCATVVASLYSFASYSSYAGRISAADQVINRVMSLSETNTYTEARTGALDRMAHLASFTINGIGLSRTGAASSKWAGQIARDPYFGPGWSFTDNAYLTLFTELGIGGLAAYFFVFLVVAYQLFIRGTFFSRVCCGYAFIILLAGFGSEEVLYSPGASMLWFYTALGIRYEPPAQQEGDWA